MKYNVLCDIPYQWYAGHRKAMNFEQFGANTSTALPNHTSAMKRKTSSNETGSWLFSLSMYKFKAKSHTSHLENVLFRRFRNKLQHETWSGQLKIRHLPLCKKKKHHTQSTTKIKYSNINSGVALQFRRRVRASKKLLNTSINLNIVTGEEKRKKNHNSVSYQQVYRKTQQRLGETPHVHMKLQERFHGGMPKKMRN